MIRALFVVAAFLGAIWVTPVVAADSGPNLEAKLRAVIADLQKGQPDYDQMAPRLSRAFHQQAAAARTQLLSLGALQGLTYRGNEDGAEIYEASFEFGKSMWAIGVSADGKIDMLVFR